MSLLARRSRSNQLAPLYRQAWIAIPLYSQHAALTNLPEELMLSYQFDLRRDLRMFPLDQVSVQIGGFNSKKGA